MVTLALFFLFFSIESAFSPQRLLRQDVRSHDRAVFAPAAPVNRPGHFHTVMRTTTLDVSQWLICTAVALSIVVPPRSAKQGCDRPLPVPDGAQVLRRQRAVPRPSLRRQHRALTGPRPLYNGSCSTFRRPAGAADRAPPPAGSPGPGLDIIVHHS